MYVYGKLKNNDLEKWIRIKLGQDYFRIKICLILNLQGCKGIRSAFLVKVPVVSNVLFLNLID